MDASWRSFLQCISFARCIESLVPGESSACKKGGLSPQQELSSHGSPPPGLLAYATLRLGGDWRAATSPFCQPLLCLAPCNIMAAVVHHAFTMAPRLR